MRTVPDIPQKAVDVVAGKIWHGTEAGVGQARMIARDALEAAAPILAEHVAQAITAHKYAHEPKGPLIGGKSAEEQRRRTWRRHFGIAARVASLAFSTEEDVRRMAAEAIARGDFIGCPAPEPRED